MNRGELLGLLHRKTNGVIAQAGDRRHVALCPAHSDKNPSLSVGEGSDGRVLLKCFAGCSVGDVCSALGITQADLFPEKRQKDFVVQTQKTEYSYKDEQGKVLYKKIRVMNGSSKSFYYERRAQNGEIVRDLNGCRKVLYRLPELLKGIASGTQIFLVEGEKDAENLVLHGLVASTTSNSLVWNDDFTQVLQDADVVVLYDMDKTGFKRRDLLCEKLVGKVKRLRVVDLPELTYTESHGKDVSDWLAMGNTVLQLLAIVDTTADYAVAKKESTVQKNRIRVVAMNEFLTMGFPPREMLLAPFLPTQGLAMLYAKRGVGKTHVALGIAYAVAAGGSFLKWMAPVAKKVLYIDGEMPAVSIQERVRKLFGSTTQTDVAEFFRLITPDLQEGAMPDLSTKEGRDSVDAFVGDSDLIIVDNVSTLFRSGNENEAEAWQAAQDWALALRKSGKSVLFVHHAGKGGMQRGTSKREDILDAVITLKHPEDYKFEQGARFEVCFEKARHFSGEEAANFNVELRELADGSWEWAISGNPISEEVSNIAEMRNLGLTIEAIMKETKLSKSKVTTRIGWAKERGLLVE